MGWITTESITAEKIRTLMSENLNTGILNNGQLNRETLAAAVPHIGGAHSIAGLEGAITIHRDAHGIPHVKAESEHDAFFGQGFIHGEDRLWHLEYDRRRAYGTWAEAVGTIGLESDIMMRRFDISGALPPILAGLAPKTRAMLEAYAEGVNAFMNSGQPLGIEFDLTGVSPSIWRPEDSLAVFMVRHILMGVWESKVWRARMLAVMGPEAVAAFHPGYQSGQLVIVPPAGRFGGNPLDAYDTLKDSLAHLTFLRHGNEDGSNNWVIGPKHTAGGAPLLAGDPHRALDVPNVYYQNHVACKAFDAIGFSFPGVPGFPHFAHTARVAWGITHGCGDYQDLFIERFEGGESLRYEFQGEWYEAEVARQTIAVRGGEDVPLEVWRTRNGPVVSGDPREGNALSFRYTAQRSPNRTLDALRAMLLADNADQLEDSMRDWVDPVNNMVYFDLDGKYGYRTRGSLPLRHEANGWTLVPGWSGDHDWNGEISFEDLPSVRNPQCGYAYTANNRITDEHYPHYIGLDYAPGFRAERINACLEGRTGLTVEDMAAIQADVASVPASGFKPIWDRLTPASGEAKEALALLQSWDGRMTRESAAPTVFAALRKNLMRRLLEPGFDPGLLAEIFTAVDRGANGLLTRTQARLHTLIADDDTTLLPQGVSWDELLNGALSDAVVELAAQLGGAPGAWLWERVHSTAAEHVLTPAFPQHAAVLNPPVFGMDGDGDTVQAGGYYAAQDFRARFISVARYIFDGSDWENSRWIVPAGASGHPGSPHYVDQVPLYADH